MAMTVNSKASLDEFSPEDCPLPVALPVRNPSAAERGDARPDENHASTWNEYEPEQARRETTVEVAGPFVLTFWMSAPVES